MITTTHLSQEIFAIDMLTALTEHSCKHVVRSLRFYGDQALLLLFLEEELGPQLTTG